MRLAHVLKYRNVSVIARRPAFLCASAVVPYFSCDPTGVSLFGYFESSTRTPILFSADVQNSRG